MENKVQTVKIGSKAWEPYANQMKQWFKSWDSVSQANWILANPEDYVRFNDQLREGALCILNNEGFEFNKYRNQLLRKATL